MTYMYLFVKKLTVQFTTRTQNCIFHWKIYLHFMYKIIIIISGFAENNYYALQFLPKLCLINAHAISVATCTCIYMYVDFVKNMLGF